MKIEHKNLKRKVKREFKTLMSVLYEWDPILRPYNDTGTIVDHTPFGEYECLADGILSLYHRGCPKEDIHRFIKKMLKEYFGIRRTDKEIVWGTELVWKTLKTFE
jgi:hypothetical protein